MKNQILSWEIQNYTSNVVTVLKAGHKIISKKLTKSQVEKAVGRKLKVCPANMNPDFIVGARVEENGIEYIDARVSLRGTTQRCYLLAN